MPNAHTANKNGAMEPPNPIPRPDHSGTRRGDTTKPKSLAAKAGAMRLRLFALAVVLLFALATVPTGQSQAANCPPDRCPKTSTPTILYFHIWDTFNKFPINTQEPFLPEKFFQVGGTNFPTVPDSPVIQGFDFNTIYGFSTAGLVEYEFIENGRPRLHPERGIAADVLIDSNVQPEVFFYMEVRDPTGDDTGPNILPAWTVRVLVREGDDVGPDGRLDAGAKIMEGQLTAHVATGPGGAAPPGVGGNSIAGTPVLVPDEDGVVLFRVPLDVIQDKIKKQEAYNVRIDWYQDPSPGGTQEDTFAEGWYRVVMDDKHLPRMELSIMNPVYIDYIHPQVAAGVLLIHTGVNSPWGTYDIDPDNITLSVAGPSPPQKLEKFISQNQHVHGLHDQAAEITYLWRFRKEDAKNGEYQIEMEVPNLLGTRTAKGSAGFVIEGKRSYGIDESGQEVETIDPTTGGGSSSKGSPGAPAILMALAMLGAAMALKRRRV